VVVVGEGSRHPLQDSGQQLGRLDRLGHLPDRLGHPLLGRLGRPLDRDQPLQQQQQLQ